ncbi:MAG: stage 0 sporulation family protein [Clostridia bacterium]
MASVIGVRFKKVGKIYYFNPTDLKISIGENVIVETTRGVEFGEVVISNREVKKVSGELKKVVRIATKKDVDTYENNKKKEQEAYDVCVEKIKKHKIDMNLISAEYTFDESKILFYFTAEGRVDFRDLVKDLAGVFRTRIELRQIGVRDKSKMVGGLGICGRALCCSTFLDDFQPVSINMAKDQGLSLNPVKISGTCGRLMCCLKYEQDVYEDLNAVAPPYGSIVKTPNGKGMVIENQILKRSVRVKLEDVDVPETFSLDDIKILKKGKVYTDNKNADQAPQRGRNKKNKDNN